MKCDKCGFDDKGTGDFAHPCGPVIPVNVKVNSKDEFLKEFKALLTKYNVDITFNVSECSDTYGLSGEKMVISHTVPGTHKTEKWFEVRGWYIEASDI